MPTSCSRVRSFALLSLILASLTPLAAPAWADSPARGWFWYQEPPPPPASAPAHKVKPPVKPLPVASKPAPKASAPAPAPAASEPAPLSVKWLREKLPEYRDRAIDDPTPQNVAAYQALTRIMFDKAQNFAEASIKAKELYPGLSQATFTPFDTNSLMNTKYYQESIRPVAIKQIFEHAGLMFFFDSTCQFCLNQWRQLQVFKVDAPNAEIMAISADDKPMPNVKMTWQPNNGVTQTFGIKLYPTIALVWPPNHIALVAQGAVNASEIESNVLNAAVDHGLLPKSYSRWIKPFEQGVLTPLDLNRIAKHDSKTPQDILNAVGQATLKQYQQMDGN